MGERFTYPSHLSPFTSHLSYASRPRSLLRLAHIADRGSFILGGPCMPEVIIHEDENFERALKRFKKKCEKAGILSDLRKHRHYEKPSERRKRKMNAARRKNRRSRSER